MQNTDRSELVEERIIYKMNPCFLGGSPRGSWSCLISPCERFLSGVPNIASPSTTSTAAWCARRSTSPRRCSSPSAWQTRWMWTLATKLATWSPLRTAAPAKPSWGWSGGLGLQGPMALGLCSTIREERVLVIYLLHVWNWSARHPPDMRWWFSYPGIIGDFLSKRLPQLPVILREKVRLVRWDPRPSSLCFSSSSWWVHPSYLCGSQVDTCVWFSRAPVPSAWNADASSGCGWFLLGMQDPGRGSRLQGGSPHPPVLCDGKHCRTSVELGTSLHVAGSISVCLSLLCRVLQVPRILFSSYHKVREKGIFLSLFLPSLWDFLYTEGSESLTHRGTEERKKIMGKIIASSAPGQCFSRSFIS